MPELIAVNIDPCCRYCEHLIISWRVGKHSMATFKCELDDQPLRDPLHTVCNEHIQLSMKGK